MRGGALAVVVVSLVGAHWAHAFVQDRSPKTGARLRWKGGTVTLTLARTALSQDLRDSEVRRAVAAALEAWDRRNNPCSSIELRLAEHTTDNEVVEDGVNSLSFREERWSRNGRAEALARYQPNAVALTTLFAKPGSSKSVAIIAEADIELNGVDYFFSSDDRAFQSRGSRTVDLQTVLMHEIGHILGLGHNCAMSEQERRLMGKQGRNVLLCSSAGPSVRGAVMFPIESLAVSPVFRRLSADDRRALCALYPARRLAK